MLSIKCGIFLQGFNNVYFLTFTMINTVTNLRHDHGKVRTLETLGTIALSLSII